MGKKQQAQKKGVYNIIERDGMDKPFWHRVGIAFVNRDGSYNVYLDSLPMDGKLHIRDFPEEE